MHFEINRLNSVMENVTLGKKYKSFAHLTLEHTPLGCDVRKESCCVVENNPEVKRHGQHICFARLKSKTLIRY